VGPPGHLGIGFAAKRVAPDAPLWALLVASEALDFLSFGFQSLGLESFGSTEISMKHGLVMLEYGSVPYSHGLLMSIVWSLLFGAIAYLITKNQRTSLVLGLVVFSHWVLDLIVHPPDLPILFENSLKLGLGLWSSGPGFIASIILEFTLLIGGIIVYIRWRRSKSVEE